jgi:hypothetical protein
VQRYMVSCRSTASYRSVHLRSLGRPRVRGFASLLIVSLVLCVGCASTSGRRPAPDDAAGVVSDAASATSEPEATPGDGGSGGRPGRTGSASPTADTVRRPDPAAPVRRAAGPVTGRGFTAREIRIGYGFSDDARAVQDSLRVKGIDQGDIRAQMTAVAKEINREGGILGRRIVLRGHNISTAELLRDANAVQQQACTAWSEDHIVFAVANPYTSGGNLRDCLRKHNTPLVVSGERVPQAEYDKRPTLLYQPGFMTTERYYRLWTARLVAQQYFTGWDVNRGDPGTAPVKIGYLGPDVPESRHWLVVIKRELARYGRKISSQVLYPATADGVAAASQNAVLRFRSEGITHVFGAALFFFQAADSQGYYPRHAITLPANDFAGAVSPDQLHGAIGAGLNPAVDVDAARDPGRLNRSDTRCRAIMERAGLDTRSDRTTLWAMQVACDSLFVLRDALTASGVLTVPSLSGGVASLGSRFESAQTFRSFFGARRFASATAMRDFAYGDPCRCFAYRGPLRSDTGV